MNPRPVEWGEFEVSSWRPFVRFHLSNPQTWRKPESPGAVRRRYRCWRGAPRRPQGPPTELDPGPDLGEAGVVIKAFLGLVEIKRLPRGTNSVGQKGNGSLAV